jgi:methylisocitrate lyase
MYKKFAAAVKVPVLANITEFGATPLFTVDELRGADVGWCCTRCRPSAP